ncbi:ARM repeat-containing protein [Coemansia reversa NRRL 1564]|uniref:Importin subunit alpha n=1 Tax=Coemansia reversa (strain ATCC 12441 / NRRL 1564) TaxID=763665 RepID=A0A2G5BL77_COERN|nr:ARM repeat-containing protein [Coemansia reversa NRRL 1564]|eukprot:PIA19741.1 ARM repeat-containing protein [Coemansia reversa NRRL 1564]
MRPRFKELYKPVPSRRDVRQRRLSREAQLRRFHREQLFMGKRLRFRPSQESETESEYEFTRSDTEVIANKLKSTKHEDRMSALTELSTKLEQPSEELRKFVLEGTCMDLLIGFLNATDADEKLQCLWCLTNIAAGEKSMAEKTLVTVPYLLTLVSGKNMELQNQSIWAIGNLAAEGETEREKLFANGVLQPLVEVARDATDEMVLQTACFALSNMARKPNTYFNSLFDLTLPIVVKQLEAFQNNAECVVELAWVCTYLTASSSETQLDQITATTVIKRLLQSAKGMSGAALIPVVRTLGNIAAGTDAQTHALVERDGFVTLLLRCIEETSSRALEKEALWVMSNVTAGRKDDVDAVVGAGVLTDLVRIVEKQNFDIKKLAAYSLLNIAIIGHRVSDLPNPRLLPEFVEFIRCQDEELVRMGVQYVALLFEQLTTNDSIQLLRNVPVAIDALENLVAVTTDDDTRALVSALIDQYYQDDMRDA